MSNFNDKYSSELPEFGLGIKIQTTDDGKYSQFDLPPEQEQYLRKNFSFGDKNIEDYKVNFHEINIEREKLCSALEVKYNIELEERLRESPKKDPETIKTIQENLQNELKERLRELDKKVIKAQESTRFFRRKPSAIAFDASKIYKYESQNIVRKFGKKSDGKNKYLDKISTKIQDGLLPDKMDEYKKEANRGWFMSKMKRYGDYIKKHPLKFATGFIVVGGLIVATILSGGVALGVVMPKLLTVAGTQILGAMTTAATSTAGGQIIGGVVIAAKVAATVVVGAATLGVMYAASPGSHGSSILWSSSSKDKTQEKADFDNFFNQLKNEGVKLSSLNDISDIYKGDLVSNLDNNRVSNHVSRVTFRNDTIKEEPGFFQSIGDSIKGMGKSISDFFNGDTATIAPKDVKNENINATNLGFSATISDRLEGFQVGSSSPQNESSQKSNTSRKSGCTEQCIESSKISLINIKDFLDNVKQVKDLKVEGEKLDFSISKGSENGRKDLKCSVDNSDSKHTKYNFAESPNNDAIKTMFKAMLTAYQKSNHSTFTVNLDVKPEVKERYIKCFNEVKDNMAFGVKSKPEISNSSLESKAKPEEKPKESTRHAASP